MEAAYILNKGGDHKKVYCYANHADCDMFAVLIPFQFKAFQNGVTFLLKVAKNVLFYDPLLFFWAQL